MKRVVRRTWFWIVWAIVGVLVDEYIKEGYLFKISDVFSNNITHEKIIVILFTMLLLYSIIIKYRAKTVDKST